MMQVDESTYKPHPGYMAFEFLTRNIIASGLHDAIVSQQMRQPHPDFPVSAKSGSVFEEKEND